MPTLCVEEESSIDSQIVGNIVRFLSNENKNGGPDSFINKVTKNAILTACLFTQSTGIEKIRKRLSINKDYFYKFTNNNDNKCNIQSNNLQLPKHNKYIVKTLKLQVKVIDLFCHSDKSSSIDSNARKVTMVTPDSPHLQRVWRVKTGQEQYDLFKQSDIVDEFRRVHNNRFVIPSISTFLQYLCKCVKIQHSCRVWMSTLALSLIT